MPTADGTSHSRDRVGLPRAPSSSPPCGFSRLPHPTAGPRGAGAGLHAPHSARPRSTGPTPQGACPPGTWDSDLTWKWGFCSCHKLKWGHTRREWTHNPRTTVLIRRGTSTDTDMQEGQSCEDRGKDRSDVTPNRQSPGSPEAGSGVEGLPDGPRGGAGPCQHLDFGLAASRTVRKEIPAALSHPFAVVCEDIPGSRTQWLTQSLVPGRFSGNVRENEEETGPMNWTQNLAGLSSLAMPASSATTASV